MFTDRQLDQCFSDIGKTFGGRKEDYFAVLYLAQRFDLSKEEASKWVTFGGFDYGVDAYYMDNNFQNLFLYQFKWSVSTSQLVHSIDRIIDEGLDAIVGNNPPETQRNPLINRLRADIRERQGQIKRVFLCFVSRGKLPPRGSNAALDSRLEDLERSTSKLKAFFSDGLEIFVRLNDDAAPPPHFSFPIRWSTQVVENLKDGETLNVSFVSLIDFARMYQKMNLRLFQKNIRAGLSEDTVPNRALKKAFQEIASGKSDPKTFVFKHNGITLEAAHLLQADGNAQVVEPRILNGAQTIVTLHRLVFPEKGEPPTPEEMARLEEIRVLAKVLYSCDERLVTDVAIANNKQNPVKPWNLRASDRYQIDLEQRFKETLHLKYDRLENAHKAKGESDWEDEGFKFGRLIEIQKLGLTLAACGGELDKMSRMPEVWEYEESYRSLFNSKFIEDSYDLRRIVVAYNIQFCLAALVQEIAARGERKYGFIVRGRNLVWALIIQAILNDPDLDAILEDYGEEVGAGQAFRTKMKSLATTKLVPILKSAVGLPAFRDQIKEERFSFLRTNAFFRVCRDQGSNSWGWAFKRI
jgi:hypothetical protein